MCCKSFCLICLWLGVILVACLARWKLCSGMFLPPPSGFAEGGGNWITVLSSRISHNIVNPLFFNFKKMKRINLSWAPAVYQALCQVLWGTSCFLLWLTLSPQYSQEAKADRGQVTCPGSPASKGRSWVCTWAVRGQGLHTLCLAPAHRPPHTPHTWGLETPRVLNRKRERGRSECCQEATDRIHFQWKRQRVCCTLPFKFKMRDDMHVCTCMSEWFSRIYKEPFITVSSGTENKGLR